MASFESVSWRRNELAESGFARTLVTAPVVDSPSISCTVVGTSPFGMMHATRCSTSRVVLPMMSAMIASTFVSVSTLATSARAVR